jgi:hypothetical protein
MFGRHQGSVYTNSITAITIEKLLKIVALSTTVMIVSILILYQWYYNNDKDLDSIKLICVVLCDCCEPRLK